MARTNCRFGLRLSRPDGTELGVVPVKPDWGPPCQGVALAGMRRGKLPLVPPTVESAVVEPVWDPAAPAGGDGDWRGTLGFRVRVDDGKNGGFTEEFPTEYFRSVAQTASSLFVEAGVLVEGETFKWELVATAPEVQTQPGVGASGFEFEELREELRWVESCLTDFIERAEPQEPLYADRITTFIHAAVIEECRALARASGDKETGGILVGHLHRDSTIPDLFTEVTAQIPATHVRSGLTSLTFTAGTWTAVRAAVDRRGLNELILGWWHYHPGAMLGTPDSAPRVEKSAGTSTVFLSADDVMLTRTCFPAAYSVALCVGETAEGEESWGLFGWYRGKLMWRGYYLLEGSGPDVVATVAAHGDEPEG